MKAIKDLTVKCTYTVGMKNVEVPDEVYKSLMEFESNGYVPEADLAPSEHINAVDWIADNIKEGNAYDFEYEITECE